MKIQDVIKKAMSDEKFAADLHTQAKAAASAGEGSDEWYKYMKQFASTPDELAQLQTVGGMKTFGITTLTTTTTYTTAACTTTGTTTTTTTN